MLTLGGKQKMTVVNLSGLNRLIMKAKTEIALQYQDWVMDNVVGSVIETGSYSVAPKQETNIMVLTSFAEALRLAAD